MEHDRSMTTPKQTSRVGLWQLRVSEQRTLLLVGDFIVALISLGVSLYSWGVSERFTGFSMEFLQKRVPFWFYFLPVVWLVLMVELYDVHRAGDWWKTVRGVAAAALAGLVLYLVLYFYYANPPHSFAPAVWLLFLVFYCRVDFIVGAGCTSKYLLPSGLCAGCPGWGGISGKLLLDVINRLERRPFVLVGIIDDDHRKLGMFIEGSAR
jgi:hypothetical protein